MVFRLVALASIAFGPGFLHPAAGQEVEPDFERQVAPILAARCVNCHGEKQAKGGLSLATREAMLKGGETGLPAIEPGDPGASYLIEMVEGEKPDMPRGGKPLEALEVETLKRWISSGASWPAGLTLESHEAAVGPWWSLQPIVKPPVPRVANSQIRTPIDAFVVIKLKEAGLAFRPEASRRTLIRRLTFDLHGLPPTPEEIKSFEADTEPDAYERLVDRLLASPRYGERWGRHWLDVAHYADTHGYDKDKRRPNAWPYRDYVIKALNDDRPYARFVREQVAGDVLDPADPQATVATGFIAAGPWDFVGNVELREGTVDKQKTRLLDRDDMLANTMSTFASLTVHCARCHDHKFDPIPQADYYRLQAVFAGVDRGDRPYDEPLQAEARRELASNQRALNTRLKAIESEVATLAGPALGTIDDELASLDQAIVDLENSPSTSEASPTNGYHSAIEKAANLEKWVQVDLGRAVPIDEVRLIPARPVDFPDTPGFGFPRRFRIEAAENPDFSDPVVLLDHTSSDAPNPGNRWWVVRPEAGLNARVIRVTASTLWPRSGDFVFALGELQVLSNEKNLAESAAVSALDSIEAGRWSTRHLVDGNDSRMRLNDEAGQTQAAQRASLDFERRNLQEQRAAIVLKATPPALRDEQAEIEVALKINADQLSSLSNQPQVYAVVSREPRPISVLARGEVEQPLSLIGPGALSCVESLSAVFADTQNESDRRLALADWLADARNPLTWRSIVNRAWQYHFGAGLVATSNDFGRNGSLPSHPELLDWLAATFRDELDGSLKGLHRLILTSAVYRQESTHDDQAAQLDAGNRLLWRQNRRRLEAEELRDAVLAVSGSLDSKMGGPGFDLFRFKDDHSPVYDHDDPAWIDPPAGRRRSIYRFAVRSVPNPWLECLDAADPNTSVPVRNETVTPLQALALWNDLFVLKRSEALAARLESVFPESSNRVETAFWKALGRAPTAQERQALVAHAASHGLASACRVLFNTSEFCYID